MPSKYELSVEDFRASQSIGVDQLLLHRQRPGFQHAVRSSLRSHGIHLRVVLLNKFKIPFPLL